LTAEKLLHNLSIATVVILASLMPLAIWAVFHIPIGTADAHQWLPSGRIERQRYDEFLKQFGSDQVLLASWDGATLDDPRVHHYVALLSNEVSSRNLLTAVISPREVVEALEQSPLALKRTAAIDRLTGTFLGKTGTLALAIYVSPRGAMEHQLTVELLRNLADEVSHLGREKLRLVGSVYESFAVDQAAEESLANLVLPSSILALLFSWICLGSLWAVSLVMILAGSGQLVAVALVYYCGYEFSAVMIVLPTLVFTLTLAGAVHLVNYLFEAQRQNGTATGVDALIKGWWPCTLSSATTMLGMLSLLSSELLPVRQFGLMSACCLGIATLILLLAFPAVADLVFLLDRLLRKTLQRQQPALAATYLAKPAFLRIPNRAAAAFLVGQWKYSRAIVIGSMITLAVASVGLARLQSSTKFCEMFPADNPTHQDLVWFEEQIGPIATVEVLLRYARDEDANLLSQAQQVIDLASQLTGSKPIGATYSAAIFLPPQNEARGIRATAVRAAQKRSLEANIDRLQAQSLLIQTDTETVWRLSARVPAVSPLGYGELTAIVKERIESALKGSTLQPNVELTGLYPVLHETQMTLLSDLGYSFLSAYLLITPIMMVVVRGVLGGLLIMIPNVMPIAMAFGTLGWLGWKLDIAGVLTASIALGIAVDDTLHFVCWYMTERRANFWPKVAVARTFRACSTAMLQTTLICCCSMLPFLFADFVPTQQFASLMISILIVALVADLVLLPAILLQAGKLIGDRR
jgi:uncharacterized protein